MKNDKIRDFVFVLFLINIPLTFLGNFLLNGLIYLFVFIFDMIDSYRRNVRQDLRGHIAKIFNLLFAIFICLVGIADILE